MLKCNKIIPKNLFQQKRNGTDTTEMRRAILCVSLVAYCCQLLTTISVVEAAPGLKAILSFRVPDQ